MPNVANVTTGKPAVTGAVFRAPVGTTLPTDATTALDNAFVELGYVSEDGITNTNTPESDNIKAWGGQVVLVVQTEKSDEWGLTLLESLNPNVLKTVYGDANVTQTGTAITVQATAEELADQSYVFEMLLKGGVKQRVVIPTGSISEVGEVVYKDDEAVGYELTIIALPNARGVTHFKYILPPSGD